MSHYCDYEYEIKSSTAFHSTSSFPVKNRWRVKLFLLKGEEWYDKGIGYIHIKQIAKEYFLTLISEDEQKTLFEIKINYNSEFKNQRGTIITLKDNNSENEDVAISFQEKEGLRDTLKIIFQIQGKEFNDETIVKDEEDFLQYEISEKSLKDLLDELSIAIKNNDIKKYRYIVDTLMFDNGKVIHEIGIIFRENEKLNNIEVLSMIYLIFKNIVSIADQNLLEMLVSDQFYLLSFGALEYDVDLLKTHNFTHHRKFLEEESNFINYFDIQDSEFIYKIHTNYRLSYLRDVAIGRFIEENTLKNISIIIQNNNADLIQFFIYNKNYIQQLFFRIENQSLDRKHEGILFLLELTQISRELIFQVKKLFYDILCEYKFFELIENTIGLISLDDLQDLYESPVIDKLESMKINLIQILLNSLISVPNLVKNFIIFRSQKNREHSLLNEFCDLLLKNDNYGTKYEITEFLKGLLDNDVNEKKNDFYELFFGKNLRKLIDFLENKLLDNKIMLKRDVLNSRQLIIEILCHCLKHHGQRMRYYTIQNHLVKVVLELYDDTSKIINMMIIKFIKSVVFNKDEFLNDILIKENGFEFIFKIFLSNFDKNNLILSCILDLFNFISKSKLENLLSYLFESYNQIILNPKYANFFKDIIRVYEGVNKPLYQMGLSTFPMDLKAYDIKEEISQDTSQIYRYENHFNSLIKQDKLFLNKKHYLIFEEDCLFNNNSKK